MDLFFFLGPFSAVAFTCCQAKNFSAPVNHVEVALVIIFIPSHEASLIDINHYKELILNEKPKSDGQFWVSNFLRLP